MTPTEAFFSGAVFGALLVVVGVVLACRFISWRFDRAIERQHRDDEAAKVTVNLECPFATGDSMDEFAEMMNRGLDRQLKG